jgi:hypothetical protein
MRTEDILPAKLKIGVKCLFPSVDDAVKLSIFIKDSKKTPGFIPDNGYPAAGKPLLRARILKS